MKDDHTKHAARIWEQAAKVRIGMLTFSEGDDRLTSRPMTIQQVEPGGVVWFFTNQVGGVAEHLRTATPVNLTVADHDESLYVSASGSASIVEDRAKVKELWGMLAKSWFPGGPEDPNLALVRMSIQAAEYWDSDHSRMVQLALMAKAAMTGEPPLDIGSHGPLGVPEKV